jgi:hypothetical protein
MAVVTTAAAISRFFYLVDKLSCPSSLLNRKAPLTRRAARAVVNFDASDSSRHRPVRVQSRVVTETDEELRKGNEMKAASRPTRFRHN